MLALQVWVGIKFTWDRHTDRHIYIRDRHKDRHTYGTDTHDIRKTVFMLKTFLFVVGSVPK